MTIHFQANSILASDRTTSKKKSKKDDFLEEENILKQALTANPCDGSTASGEPELLHCNLYDFVPLRFAWDFDQLSSKHWGVRHPFDWEFFNSGRGERVQGCGGKPHCRSDLSNLKIFFSGSDSFLSKIKLQIWSTARRGLQDLSAVNVCKIWMNPMQIGSR